MNQPRAIKTTWKIQRTIILSYANFVFSSLFWCVYPVPTNKRKTIKLKPICTLKLLKFKQFSFFLNLVSTQWEVLVVCLICFNKMHSVVASMKFEAVITGNTNCTLKRVDLIAVIVRWKIFQFSGLAISFGTSVATTIKTIMCYKKVLGNF